MSTLLLAYIPFAALVSTFCEISVPKVENENDECSRLYSFKVIEMVYNSSPLEQPALQI